MAANCERKELSEGEFRLLGSQQSEILTFFTPHATCVCGETVPVLEMYRCFGCGIYFCARCAAKHFGYKTD